MNIISPKVAQQIVDTVKDVCGQNINYIDEKGMIIASTDHSRIGSFHAVGKEVIKTGSTIEVSESDSYYGTQQGVNIPITYKGKILAAVGISGAPSEVRKYGYLAQKITSILLKERELDSLGRQRQTRLNYMIRSIVNEEELSRSHIDSFLKEYQIDDTILYRTLLIRQSSGYDILSSPDLQQTITQTLAQMESRLYTFNYPGEYIIFIPETMYRQQLPSLYKLIESANGRLRAGIGNPQKLLHQSASYRNAILAVKSLRPGQTLALYEELDFELILGSLTPEAREQFLQKTIQPLSPDELQLLRTYFEENMSLMNTGKRLFMHKNTLQYKLNRIFSLCGYNPRIFQDAVVLYSAIKLIS